MEQIQNLLRSALKSKPKIDWGKLVAEYPLPKPTYPNPVVCPNKPQADEPKLVYRQCPDKPQIEREPTPPYHLKSPPEPIKKGWVQESLYERAYSIWSEEVKKIEAENKRHNDEYLTAIQRWNSPQRRVEEEQTIAKWSEACKQIDDENMRRKNEHPSVVNRWKLEHEQAVAEWNELYKQAETENIRRHNEHTAALEIWNAGRIEHEEKEVAKLKADYKSLLPGAVVDFFKRVLSLSDFPDGSRRKLNLEYVPETKILIVDYLLPAPDDLPRVKELKYVKSRDEEVEVYFSEKEFNEIYDDVLYQICLRSLYELFKTDDANALSAVVFNGWVESVDKATGNDSTSLCDVGSCEEGRISENQSRQS